MWDGRDAHVHFAGHHSATNFRLLYLPALLGCSLGWLGTSEELIYVTVLNEGR